MSIKISVQDNIIVIKLAGRFDAYQAPQLEKCFQAIYSGELTGNNNPEIVIDLTQVNFIDSTGLSTFVQAKKRCDAQDRRIILCNLQKPARIILELTRLDKVFSIAPTQEDAVAQLSMMSTHCNIAAA